MPIPSDETWSAPKNPLQDLYNAWQASGLSLEEFKRRILEAAGQQYTPAPVQPPVGPASIPPPYTAAPIEPPPSYIQQLQGAAFLAPPAGTPDVVAMQGEAFNYDENAARAATGQRVIPELPLGTPEGRAATKQALAGVIPMESVPTAERITEWDRLIAQSEGYNKAATEQGQYWEKGRPSEPSMMDKIGGVIKGAGLVGGAVEALPVVGPIAGLAAQGVEMTAPFTMPIIQKGLVNPVMKGLEVWQEEVVEHKAGALITFGQGIREGDIGMMTKAWGMTPKEGKKAYHESPMPVQMVASVVADPLTWVGGGFGKAGISKLLARRGVIGPTAEMATQLAGEAEAAVKTGIRESLWMPGQSGRVEDGAKFLTPEALAAEAAPKIKAETMLTSAGKVWKPFTPEQTAARIAKVEKLADAEPAVAVPMEDALQLPRTQALTYDFQAAREAAMRTGAADAQRAMEESQNSLAWTLREQTQTAPYRVPIGQGGISTEEAARAFRNHEGYIVGDYFGVPKQFHYYDAVDDVVNRLGGFEPIRIGARPIEAARPARLAATQAAEAAVNADKTLPLDLKLSRGLSLRSSQKTWDGLSRAERATVLGRAGEDAKLAASRWAKLAPATRANAVKEMTNIAKGGAREAPVILTPAQAAGEDALLEEAWARLGNQVETAKKVRPSLVSTYHQARQTISARLGAIEKQELGQAAIGAKKQAMAGELAPGLKPVVGMTDAHKDALINAVERSQKLLSFEKANVQIALEAQWNGDKFLTPAQIEYVERAFGPEKATLITNMTRDGAMLKALKLTASLPTETGQGMMALLTSYDISAGGRQGIILFFAHPGASVRAEVRSIKALVSQGTFDAMDATMRTDPYFERITKGGGLAIQEMTVKGKTAEQYSGRLVGWMEKHIPGIKQSERAFVSFLNQQRYMVVRDWLVRNEAKGEVPLSQLQEYCRSVNWATGVGTVPMTADKFLKPILWTPKLTLSRFEYPFSFLTANGAARRAIIKDEMAFAGGVATILGLAKLTGAADVEIDPRSTDLIKLRIGPTRIDITGGEALLVRTFAQLVTGQRKEASGVMQNVNRWTVGERFLQSKVQPLIGLLADVKQGHTFVGEELTATGSTFKTQIFNRLVPLAIQDTVDAVKQWGPKGLLFGALSEVGVGVQTYSSPWTTLLEAEDKAAQANGFKNFADMASNKERGLGTNMALAAIANDPEVAAARKRVDAYRAAHGGARPMTEVTVSFTNEQLTADWTYTAGGMTPPDWRADHTARERSKVSVIKGIIMASPDLQKKYDDAKKDLGDIFALKNPTIDRMTSAYFSLFDKYENPTTGGMDASGWDALDEDLVKFRAQFTPEQLAKMDANIGITRTPVEKEYYADRETIEGSGWWNIPPNAWTMAQTDADAVAQTMTTKTKPITAADVTGLLAAAKQFKTLDEYGTAIYTNALRATGDYVAAAEALDQDPLINTVMYGTNGLVPGAQKGLMDKDPALAELVVKWGYKASLPNALLERVLTANGKSIAEVNQMLLAIGEGPIGSAEDKADALKATPALVPAMAGGLPPAPVAPAPAAPTSAIGVPPVLKPPAQPQAPVTPVVAEAGAPEATGGVTGSTGATTGTPIAAVPAVAPAAPEVKPAAGSWEAVVSRIQGEPVSTYPQAGVIDTAKAISDIGGFSLADIPPGLPPEQLKAKLAAKATWAPWISEQTWQTVGALGLTGKSTLLQVFWEMYSAAAGSTLAKTVIKNEDVKRVLDNLSTMGSATTEMYMRAFEGMTTMFNEAVTGAQEDESKALGKAVASQEKKAASAAKSAAKKSTAAADAQSAVEADRLRWERLAEELGAG